MTIQEPVLADPEPLGSAPSGAGAAGPVPFNGRDIPLAEPPVLRSPSRVARGVAAALWAVTGFAVVLAIWAYGAAKVDQLPTVKETFTAINDMLSEPFKDNGPNDQGIALMLKASMTRVLYGFGLATLVGIPLGLAMGASKRVWSAANPVIQLLRPVSPLAWFPIWLVILQDAPNAAIWVIFITALWPTVINTAAGAAAVPADHRNVAKVFRFSRPAYLRHVLIPDSLPSIVTGLRLSMGTAWMVIVAVEMLSGGTGIGSFVWFEYNALNLAKVISAVVFIGVVGLLIDLLFLRLAKAVALEESHA